MPLVAALDGARVVSIDLDDAQWVEIRRRARAGALTLPDCGSPAYLRTSRRHLRHFAHAPGHGGCGAHTRESAAHLEVKAAIVTAAREQGWHAEPEVDGPGYRADVLATSPRGMRLNFEVQLSREQDSDYLDRTAARLADGCRVLWLTRYPEAPRKPWDDDPLAEPDPLAPRARVRIVDGEFVVDLDRPVPLAGAVAELLTGAVVLRRHIVGPRLLQVVLAQQRCWKCSTPNTLWRVEHDVTTGACGAQENRETSWGAWASERPEQAVDVRRAVAERIGHERWPAAASLSSRASKEAGATYMAFSCWQCSALFGDFHLRGVWQDAEESTHLPRLSVEQGNAVHARSHWCRAGLAGTCRAVRG